MLELIPNWRKIREICEKAIHVYLSSLKYVPDLFVTPKILVVIGNTSLDKFIT